MITERMPNIIFEYKEGAPIWSYSCDLLRACLGKFGLFPAAAFIYGLESTLLCHLCSWTLLTRTVRKEESEYLLNDNWVSFCGCGLFISGTGSLFQAWEGCLHRLISTCALTLFFLYFMQRRLKFCWLMTLTKGIVRFREPVCKILKLLGHLDGTEEFLLL